MPELKILTKKPKGLTAAQRKVILLMENMGPYDRIVIQPKEHKPQEIEIISTGTIKEVFPKDML